MLVIWAGAGGLSGKPSVCSTSWMTRMPPAAGRRPNSSANRRPQTCTTWLPGSGTLRSCRSADTGSNRRCRRNRHWPCVQRLIDLMPRVATPRAGLFGREIPRALVGTPGPPGAAARPERRLPRPSALFPEGGSGASVRSATALPAQRRARTRSPTRPPPRYDARSTWNGSRRSTRDFAKNLLIARERARLRDTGS